MALRDHLPRWLGGNPSEPVLASTLAQPEGWLVDALVGAASAAGMRVSPLSSLGVPTVFACVNAISRSMSSIPLRLYRKTKEGGREVATDHALYSLLHDAPNGEMTSADFRRAVQGNATLRNNGFALIVRDGLDRVRELYPIENREVQVRRDESKQLYYVVNGVRYEKEQILHIRGLTLNGVLGTDAMTVAREPLGLAMALQDYAARYFPNSTTPSSVIEFPTTLSPEQLAKFAEQFDKHNTGTKNAHKRMILHGGAKLSPRNPTNNREGQFLESKQYQDMCICQVFGVPPIKAGITKDAHYNNVEQENQNYVTDVLMSWCTQWEQTLNQRLLTARERAYGYFFKFDLAGLLRADIKARAEALEKLHQNGVITRNEWRALEDLNPVEGGDNFVLSQNLQMLDKSGTPIQPAPETESQSQQ